MRPPTHCEGIDDEKEFIRQTAKIKPDKSIYKFLGYIQPSPEVFWVHDVKPARTVNELLKAKGIKRRCGKDDDTSDAAEGLLLSADGRLFIERNKIVKRRIKRAESLPGSGAAVSRPREEDRADESETDCECCKSQEDFTSVQPNVQSAAVGPAVGPDGRVLVADDRPMADTVHGSDGRQLITSSGYPWRAVGVALLRRTSGPGVSPATWSRGSGSGTMIGPRHVLTVAHVFTDGNGVDRIIGAAPAARGYNYANDMQPYTDCGNTPKFPWGIRRVQWYYWPSQWNGSGIKFDYAVLILADTCSSLPGWIVWGYQTTTWLDYRTMNMAGYPSPSKTCEASPEASKECDGYMYYQQEKMTSVFTNYAYSKFDAQEGQSGAGVYYRSGDSRIVYALHKGSQGRYTYAKRLRSGSFSTICDWVDNWKSQYAGNPSC